MSKESLLNYIRYMGSLIKEQAMEAKREEDNSEEGVEDYNKGCVMAYYTIISTLKNQASFFNLDQEDIGLADINPDVDLLSVPKNNDIHIE